MCLREIAFPGARSRDWRESIPKEAVDARGEGGMRAGKVEGEEEWRRGRSEGGEGCYESERDARDKGKKGRKRKGRGTEARREGERGGEGT